jgi:peptide/nickel transport system substrate-binding protein
MENGEAQITSDLAVTDISDLVENQNIDVTIQGSVKNVIGFMNTEKPPLNNADFRRALSYAFPYDDVINNVKEGHAETSIGLVPRGLWGHDDSLMPYETNMDKAKEYLNKSGINTNEIKLELTLTSGFEAWRNAAQLFQVNLKKLGIELEIREMTWDNVWEKAKNPDPMDRQDILMMVWWPDYPSPISWFNSLVHSEEDISFNLSYINDPSIDSMIEDANKLAAMDRDKAKQIFSDVQRKTIEEAYFINMYDEKAVWVTSKNFKGFKFNPIYEGVVFFYDTYYE